MQGEKRSKNNEKKPPTLQTMQKKKREKSSKMTPNKLQYQRKVCVLV